MRVVPFLVAAFLALALAAPAQAAPKVAVVDMVRVIEKHKSSKVIDANLKKAKGDADDELKRQDERLQKLKMKLEPMGENDPDRPLAEKQYLTQLNTMKFNHEWAQKMAERRYIRDVERLYKAIQALIASYARDNGIEVVLYKTDPNQAFNAGNVQDFFLKSRLRVVLYAAPGADITDAVIARIPASDRAK